MKMNQKMVVLMACIGMVMFACKKPEAPKQMSLSMTTTATGTDRAVLGGSETGTTVSHTVPCTMPNGEQTISLSDTATYTGSFSNCVPLAGPVVLRLGGKSIKGYAESDGGDCVKANFGSASVRICRVVTVVPNA